MLRKGRGNSEIYVQILYLRQDLSSQKLDGSKNRPEGPLQGQGVLDAEFQRDPSFLLL